MSQLDPMIALRDVLSGTGGTVLQQGPLAFAGVSIDSRKIVPGQLFFAIVGPNFDGHEFVAVAVAAGASGVIVHRDLAPPPGCTVVRVGDTTKALTALAVHVRTAARIPVAAITGSAGKTTTKEMAAALLATRGPVLKTEGNLNNQYGLPLTLLRLAPGHTAAVLELGMSAAGELRELSAIARPDVAAITMVAPVHLEFFQSIDGIADAKAEILEGLSATGAGVLNYDDERLRRVGEEKRASGQRIVWFGRDRRCDISAENVRGTIHGMRFTLVVGGASHDVALPLPGMHYVSNFLAAAGCALELGMPAGAIAEAASTLKPASRRGEVRSLGNGITLMDDSYNSNPTAVRAAVQALDMAAAGRRVVFLGDMLELGPTAAALHRETGEAAAAVADLLVAVGPLANEMVAGARSAGGAKDGAFAFADSTAAAAAAGDLLRPFDAVLVKGSRGIRMERVVEALVARFGGAGDAGTEVM